MRIGIPREVKTLEGRVGLIPPACADLVRQGHEVLVESGAGLASGYPDADYLRHGIRLLPDAASLYQAAELIVKVKEPQPQEWGYLRADQRLFCYLHLAAEPALTQALLDIGLTAVAFETVQEGAGLPLLQPMSAIAGRLATHYGAQLLHRPQGGKGLLLGGLAGSERGRVVVLGAGVAGQAAASVAAALGAQVTVFEKRAERRDQIHALGANLSAFYPFAEKIHEEVSQADLLIGAVLIPGARAPIVVTRETVAAMSEGSVIVDISVDQGGCIATTRATSYAEPTYTDSGVTHFCVTNMPGAVPRTASQALSSAVLPYLERLTCDGWEQDPALRGGINVAQGKIIHPAL